MRYTVTITTKETSKQLVQGDWTTIKKSGDNVDYGYPPAIEKPVEQIVKVLEQTTESLDLVAVIKAINGITT